MVKWSGRYLEMQCGGVQEICAVCVENEKRRGRKVEKEILQINIKTKMLWKDVKTLMKKESRMDEVTKDVKGRVLTGNDAVQKWWSKNFEFMNVEYVREADIVPMGGDVRMPVLEANSVAGITKEEVPEAVEVMAAEKAPGWTALRLNA